MSENLTRVLENQAARRPEQAALVHGHGGSESMISFGQLARQVEIAAAGWRRAGLKEGDAVLIFHPMSIELYVALLGLLRAGMVAVFVDPRAGLGHLKHAREKGNVRAILASPGTAWICQLMPALWGAGPLLTPARLAELGGNADAGQRRVAETNADSPALITFTSGSTGRPKGIVRTHGFLLRQHELLAEHLHLRAGEVDLTALPIFALANLASGVTSVFVPGKAGRPAEADPRLLQQQILKWKVTRSAGSPALYERLAEAPEAVRQMRQIYTGGAPVFPQLLARLQELNPDLRLVSVYGSTEAEPIAHAEWTGTQPAGGFGLFQGQPIDEINLAILKDHSGEPLGELSAARFTELRQPAGEPGEIVVSGGHVIQGYLGGEGNAETKFHVEGTAWHRTGDAGYLDEAGNLWLLGRCTAIARKSTSPADYPFAVEVAAMDFAEVERAALLEHADRRLLFLQAAREPAQLREKLHWARLDEIRVIPRIPLDRRHQAKVDYPRLRKLATHAH